jgi:hypothetical protein
MAYLPRARGGRPAESNGPIQLDRARRLFDIHQRGPGRRCGLCLQSWPCAEREWASETLTPARPAGRWSVLRWWPSPALKH